MFDNNHLLFFSILGFKLFFMKRLLYLSFIFSVFFSCKRTEGCTDPLATNFVYGASVDDGSCVYPEPIPTVTDIDGNVYETVTIGDQQWMAENLKTSSYSNGDPILHEIDSTNWLNLDSGAFCWLDNNDGNDFYGKLYNWYAVQDSRNLCPTGWHVPTNAEWNELTDYLGGNLIAGKKMKDSVLWNGYSSWNIYCPEDTCQGTNESGFTGSPWGCRWDDGDFYNFGYAGHWWSSTEEAIGVAWSRVLWYSTPMVIDTFYYVNNGFSVRCVQD